MIAFILALAAAHAAPPECAIAQGESHTVHATMTSVSIDGRLYPVRGALARGMFQAELERCGLTEASRHFTQWRTMRRTTNVTAVVGLFVFQPVIFATPVCATSAGQHRQQMVLALMSGR